MTYTIVMKVDCFSNSYQIKHWHLRVKGVQGGKLSKDRITVLFCTNTNRSDKLPLLCIGKSQKPRSFRGHVTLPTEYKSNKKAWMTSELFLDWLKKVDRKVTLQIHKICHLLDNCAAHPKKVLGLKSISLFFLPPNMTSILQLPHHGIIKNFRLLHVKCQQETCGVPRQWN